MRRSAYYALGASWAECWAEVSRGVRKRRLMRKGGKSLSSRELTALVNSEQGVVLDVRNHKDFSSGHIVDALNIPFDKLAERMVELEKHKAKTIIVVDAMGQHAGMVARDLKKAGYTAAKLGGGIASWRGDNLPVVK